MTERQVPAGPPQEGPAASRSAGSLEKQPSAKRRSRRPTGRRTYRQKIGQVAEDVAAGFLRAQGLEILDRNFRRRLGELDIVARDPNRDVLVIAEVRTRASDRYGGAAASVDPRKQQRLVRAAAQLLQQRKDLAHLRVRFDVIAVSDPGLENPQVEWIQHAFLT
jgi:putative endonuclease